MLGYYLVKKFSPNQEARIPEIEGAMIDIRPVRWWRVLPCKIYCQYWDFRFWNGIRVREGPTVQLGANIGHACK